MNAGRGAAGRRFGFGVGTVLALVGSWTLLRGANRPLGTIVLAAGGLLVACAALSPGALARPAAIWVRFGEALSAVTTPVILSIVFFLVVTPVGVLRRLAGGDPLRRRAPSRESYWDDAPARLRDPRHYEKTY